MNASARPFELTSHARVVLAERRIDPAWVCRVLASPVRTEPDRFDPSLRHALGPVEERDGRVLRVVYDPGRALRASLLHSSTAVSGGFRENTSRRES